MEADWGSPWPAPRELPVQAPGPPPGRGLSGRASGALRRKPSSLTWSRTTLRRDRWGTACELLQESTHCSTCITGSLLSPPRGPTISGACQSQSFVAQVPDINSGPNSDRCCQLGCDLAAARHPSSQGMPPEVVRQPGALHGHQRLVIFPLSMFTPRGGPVKGCKTALQVALTPL